MEDYKEHLLDRLLDELVELYGIDWTIQYLTDFGLTQEQLVELGFE